MTKQPKVGAPRIYPGHELPVLFPGEIATARFLPTHDLLRSLDSGTAVPVSDWLVEPDPALRGLYRRWRYRLVGQWIDRFCDWKATCARDV